MKNAFQKAKHFALVLAPAALIASSAHAEDAISYADMTGKMDLTTTTLAIVAVGGILVTPLVAKKGVRMVLGFFGR